MIALGLILAAVIAGAAWRRWFGSARPEWMAPIDAWWRDYFGIVRPDRGAPYRGAQIALGAIALTALCYWNGDQWWRAPIDAGAAIAFMTLPIRISRRPFEIVSEWLVAKGLLPVTKGPMLQGPAPLAEVGQGALLWGLAVAL